MIIITQISTSIYIKMEIEAGFFQIKFERPYHNSLEIWHRFLKNMKNHIEDKLNFNDMNSDCGMMIKDNHIEFYAIKHHCSSGNGYVCVSIDLDKYGDTIYDQFIKIVNDPKFICLYNLTRWDERDIDINNDIDENLEKNWI